MKKEHLSLIVNYLKSQKLTDDLVLELTDHWCCEIEDFMEKGIEFEVAFDIVKNHWKSSFNTSTSIWFGLFRSFPNIMLKKMEAITKRYQIFTLISFITILIFSFYFKIEIPDQLLNFIVIPFWVFLTTSILYFFYTIIYTTKTSIYYKLFKIYTYQLLYIYLFWTIMNGLSIDVDDVGQKLFINIVKSSLMIVKNNYIQNIGGILFYIFLLIGSYLLLYNHKKSLSKLQEFSNQ